MHYLLSSETVSILGEDCVLTVLQNVDERRRSENNVIAAVEAVLKDSAWLGEKIVEKLKISSDGSADSCESPVLIDGLSSRQAEVLALMAQGLPDLEIATRFGITRNTVRNHVRSIYSALGLHNRSEAIIWARDRGVG